MSDSPLNAALNRNWIKASAEHERLERENADLRADRDRAFKIGYEITDDCQTVEEMTSALVACIQRVRMNKDKELADLRAKLEEARKDAERLDAIERMSSTVYHSRDPENDRPMHWVVVNERRKERTGCTEITLRAAIDSAMGDK